MFCRGQGFRLEKVKYKKKEYIVDEGQVKSVIAQSVY